jgi:polyhydroxybutyrate depolymerase
VAIAASVDGRQQEHSMEPNPTGRTALTTGGASGFARAVGRVLLRIVFAIVGLLVLGAATIAVLFAVLNQTNGRIVSSGDTRRYLLFVPGTYDPATPTPLVISLHGFVEWPAHQMQISRWNDLAQEQGFLVVYPEGTGFPRRWRAGGWRGDTAPDVRFIADLIDALAADYNLDRSRVYTNGLSNGGGMSYLLGCALADRIAAVGGVAGAFVYPLEDCAPSRPVPMIVFHGTADPIVPYAGGEVRDSQRRLPVIPEWVAARAALNGCHPAPEATPASGSVSGFRYTECDEGAEVDFYTIEGGGHTWPGGEPLPEWLTGPTSKDIDATRVMWEFFQRFSIGGPGAK